MMSKNEVRISDQINPNLTIRGGAKVFFDYIENIPGDEILINFEGSKFISRSFAQEYVIQKRLIDKKIDEVEVPPQIESILKLVEKSSKPNVKELLNEL